MAWSLFKSKQDHEFLRTAALEVETGGDLDGTPSARAHVLAHVPVDDDGNVQATRTALTYRAVTPHDTDLLAQVNSKYPRAFYVGTGGNVELEAEDGTVAVWANVPDGGYVYAGAKRVKAANTTASNILALY